MAYRRIVLTFAAVMTFMLTAANIYAQEDALMVWSTTTINK